MISAEQQREAMFARAVSVSEADLQTHKYRQSLVGKPGAVGLQVADNDIGDRDLALL